MDAGRFLRALDADHAAAVAELRAGRKRSHWMWYVFPQLGALGQSDRARFYGLAGLEDAREWLAHPVLSARLSDAVAAAMASGQTDPVALFGPVDALKFRSCLTLFAAAADDPAPFAAALARFFGAEPDPQTLGLLAEAG